jgi:hypothetical protein
MATVNKNFRIKHGLVVEGSTATVNSQNILTETGGDSYILNLVGGATLVKSVDAGVFSVDGAGNLTVNANTFDSYGSASAAQGAAEATASADATSKANAAQAAAEATASADATSKANAAQAAAEATASADATSKANAAQAAAEATASADATSKANAAQAAAEDYADSLASNYDAAGSAAAAQTAAEGFATQAIANLVDSAPATLDTLNELAAALQDNPDIISDLQDIAAGKQDELTAGANIDITGATISVTGLSTDDVAEDAGNLYFTNQRALDATAAAYDVVGSGAGALEQANDYTDGEITTALTAAQGYADTAEQNAEDTAQGALDDVLDGTTSFTAINYNSVAKQVAATTGNIVTAAETTAISWVAADYRSAKFVVKVKNGVHTQVSDLVVTLDTSNNVAVSEYGITYSNGTELAAVTADYSGSDVRIRVTPANANTEVMVVGILIK